MKRVPVLEAVAALVYALVILQLVGGGIWSLRPRIDLAEWKSTLRQSTPLMVNGVARSAVISFDVLVIDLALGPHDVGIYSVASKPAFFVTSAVGLFSLAFLSAFSATGHEEAAALHGRALRRAFGVERARRRRRVAVLAPDPRWRSVSATKPRSRSSRSSRGGSRRPCSRASTEAC